MFKKTILVLTTLALSLLHFPVAYANESPETTSLYEKSHKVEIDIEFPDPKYKEIAKKYLESQGYKIIRYEASSSYEVKKEFLDTTPYANYWAVQNINPNDYIGKKIINEWFIVRNHPLERWENDEFHSIGRVRVGVSIYKDQVIGGTSFPIVMPRKPYSLDGKQRY